MNSVSEDDLACTDEIRVYEDEGEEDEQVKSSENLTEDKVGLVIESEEQVPRLFDLFGRNGSSILKMPWPTDPRFASYFLPGYPAALAAVMAAMRSSASPAGGFTGSAAADYSPSGAGGGGFLSGLASSSASPSAAAAAQLGAAPQSNSSFYTPPWESQGSHLGGMTGSGPFGSPSAGDGYLNADVQRTEDSGQGNAFSGGRLPHFLSNPFNPFMPFYHNPLQGLSSPSRNSDVIRKSSMERLVDNLDSSQNNSGLKGGLSDYSGAATQSSVSGSGGGSDFWRGGGDSTQDTNLSNLKQPTSNLPSSTTNPPPQSTANSTSLYAAVMAAAAVASWGGQAMPTPTPATNSLAPSALVKTASSTATTEVEAMARRNKSMDASKNPYSSSMFAAAAAAHMHFLSAAAAAASFTNSLPASVPSTNPDSSTTTISGVQQRGSVSGSSPLSNARMTSSGLTQKSFDLNRQNAPLKLNCDFDSTITNSPLDDACSEPEGSRLVSRLKKTHIKKPLNAFMLFMKEMRPRVQEECTLKESAAINQILGKKWHELTRAEQTKYYEMARKAKELHQRLYPGWSARDNYAYHARRRHRRSRRGFSHHRSFVSNKTTSSSSTVNTLAKTSPNGRVRSSSFHEERKSIDLPQKILERPHSAIDIYSPSLERRMMSSSSPLTPPNPSTQSQSPVTNFSSNRVSGSQPQPQSQNMPPPPTTIAKASFVPQSALPPPPTIQQGFISPSRPTSLTMSACSAFEQHYNQAASHQVPTSTQLPNPTQQQQYLQMASPQRGFVGYPPPPTSVMYGGVQGHGRGSGGAMSRQPSAGYWGYQQIQGQMSGQPAMKRSPYLSSDSVAAVAAVAAMAVGELSGGSMKKCRARFGLEHQNLWCKPCRRKKKCIRFISENEVEDYMPHHGHHPLSHHGPSQGHAPYHPHSAAAASAAAAMAFNHQTGSQTSGGTPYGIFANTARRQTAATPYSMQKPVGFMPVTAFSGGNGVPGVQTTQRPIPYSRQTMQQQLSNSAYAQLALCNVGYKRPFPMTSSTIPRQQPNDFPVSQTPAYRGSTTTDTSSSYWGSNPRSVGSATAPTFPTNSNPPNATSRFSASEMMLSQGAEPKSTHLRETQGSNSSLSYPNSTSNNNKIMNNNIFPTQARQQGTSAPSTNGGGGDVRIKREAPPISFGVADVMGFKTEEMSNAPAAAPPPTSTVYRGNAASPSTSSCPLRSSPELE